MELDEQSLDGHWSTNSNTGMDFFIINDAIFSKLCILGEDVEPCFEGARITAPEVSKTFTKMDDNFKRTLFTMMEDLQSVLKGGYKMELEDQNVETEVTTAIEEEVTNVEETSVEAPEAETEFTEEETAVEEEAAAADETDISIEATQEDSEDNKEEELEETESIEENTEEANDYALLEKDYKDLEAKYAEMETKYQELVAFKEAVDNKEKDALINSFYMLSDEDKKDVIENKSNYSLDDIEAKLSVICVRKKVNFDLDNSSKNENKVETEEKEEVATTYSLDQTDSNTVPEFIQALRSNRDSKE